MLKEIHEQADAVADDDRRPHRARGTRRSRRRGRARRVDSRGVERIVIVACGTAYHAGLIGRYAIEEWARVPRRDRRRLGVPLPQPRGRPGRSRDRDHPVGRDGRHAGGDAPRARAGATVLAITNMVGSQATRDADGVLYTRAGLEIGVAATKTFVCQVAVMYLLALRLAELRGTLPADADHELVGEIKRLPHCIDEVIAAPMRERSTEADRRRPAGRPSSSCTSVATSVCRWRSRER